MLTALPVNASSLESYLASPDYVNYHGYTTTWDRGSATYYYPNTASYSTSTGYLGAMADDGTSWAYMNSGNVNAIAAASNIRVTLFNSEHDCYKTGPSSITCQVKLYVNGNYQGVRSITTLSANNYDTFDFTGLNVHNGDSLDVDVVFTAMAVGDYGVSWITADFSYVAFTTE